VGRLIADISDLSAVHRVISAAIGCNELPPGIAVSIAVDAMAINSDGSPVPGAATENAFIFYLQPLDAQFKCFPIHLITHPSGRATAPIQATLDNVSQAAIAQGLSVKYLCADGDYCHHRRHLEFFRRWHSNFTEHGIPGALMAFTAESQAPVGDFLHIWKMFSNKIKSHPVTLVPSSADSAIYVEDLEAILQLGPALSDKSSIGRMRDSYPIQLFCMANCLKCLEHGMMHEFMYLLVWTLQEEIIRSANLSRDQRGLKAVLCFKILMHYFDLSHDICGQGVTRRFRTGSTIAVTFAEDSVWPVLLNTSLALIQFVLCADETWSFARMGTHCLENFFGLVRRESMGDDRYTVASRIIAKGSLASSIMHDLDLRIVHRGRDNVGGVAIGGNPLAFTEEQPELLFQSLIRASHLELFPTNRTDLLTMGDLRNLLAEWLANDHHQKDPIYHASFLSKPSGARIVTRLIPVLRERTESERSTPASAD
jgi:hypothetical protein